MINDHVVQVRVTGEVQERWKRAARRRQMALSDWVRGVCEMAAVGNYPTREATPPAKSKRKPSGPRQPVAGGRRSKPRRGDSGRLRAKQG